MTYVPYAPIAMNLTRLIGCILSSCGAKYKRPPVDKKRDKARRDYMTREISQYDLDCLKLGGFEADEDEIVGLCVDFNSDLIDFLDSFYNSLIEIQTNKKETNLSKPRNTKELATA